MLCGIEHEGFEQATSELFVGEALHVRLWVNRKMGERMDVRVRGRV